MKIKITDSDNYEEMRGVSLPAVVNGDVQVSARNGCVAVFQGEELNAHGANFLLGEEVIFRDGTFLIEEAQPLQKAEPKINKKELLQVSTEIFCHRGETVEASVELAKALILECEK